MTRGGHLSLVRRIARFKAMLWAVLTLLLDPSEPPRIARFLNASEAQYREAVVAAERYVKDLAAGRIPATNRRKRLGELRKQLKELKANKQIYVPDLPLPPAIGDVGCLRFDRIRVADVFGPRELLVELRFVEHAPEWREGEQGREFLVDQTQTRRWMVLLRGVDPKLLENPNGATVFGPFEVTSQEPYNSPTAGSGRALVLVPYDLEQVKPYWQQRRKRDQRTTVGPQTNAGS